MLGGRVSSSVGTAALALLAVIVLLVVGVFASNAAVGEEGGHEASTKTEKSSDGALGSNNEMSANENTSNLLPDPFGAIGDILFNMGIRTASGVTQEVQVAPDPPDDFVPSRSQVPMGSDPTADIREYIGSAAVKVTDGDVCGINKSPAFRCGEHYTYHVGCSGKPEPIETGLYHMFVGKLSGPIDQTGDVSSRRFTLILDDGDPSNDRLAGLGYENDFHLGANTLYRLERPSQSNNWLVLRTDTKPGSSKTTSQIGARGIVAGDTFAFLIPTDELPSRPAGDERIVGRLVAEVFSGPLPDWNSTTVSDETKTYSADILGDVQEPLGELSPSTTDASTFATCP